MPYDPEVNDRVQAIVGQWPHTAAKKMFGGVCHLLNGNMVCGVHKACLILRLGEAQAKIAMQKEHVGPFDITGRPMKGWVMVSPDGFAGGSALADWLDQARRFVETLPAK